jgi:hypothetical protein
MDRLNHPQGFVRPNPALASTCRFGMNCTNVNCTFTHPQGFVRPNPALASTCRFGMNCTNVNCTFTHPQGFVRPNPALASTCRFGMNCTNVNCTSTHPQGFVRPNPVLASTCRSGMNCTNVNCRLNHPPGFQSPIRDCLSGANCKNAECTFTHPSTRPKICPNGLYCGKSCLKLHPESEFDKIFRQKGKFFGPRMSSIAEARKSHKAKISPLITHGGPTNDQNDALCDELIKQLNAFDDVFIKILKTATTKIPKELVNREIFRLNLSLPALALRDDITKTVSANQFTIVQVMNTLLFLHSSSSIGRDREWEVNSAPTIYCRTFPSNTSRDLYTTS